MALVVKDRVKETTATTGTGTLTLAGAVAGFQTFTSVLSNGDTTYYGIFESSTGEFEVGLGTFTSSGTTLARTTILESSNSGSAVNLTAGAADVFITQPAEKAVYLDASGHIATADGRNVTNVAASTATTAGTVTTAAQPNITSLGTLTTLTVDDITINGSTISDAGEFTIDGGDVIVLDADNSGVIRVKDGGTHYGSLYKTGNNFSVYSAISDADLVFQGNDGGVLVTALTLDMSAAGAATFNVGATFGGNVDIGGYYLDNVEDIYLRDKLFHDGDIDTYLGFDTNTINLVTGGSTRLTANSSGVTISDITINGSTISDAGDLDFDIGGDLNIDVDGGDVRLKDGGTQFASLYKSGNNFGVYSAISDGDLLFQGVDGGVLVTALTLDMSNSGNAVFNNHVYLPDNGKAIFGAGSDLQIFHDGSNSKILDGGVGNLHILADNEVYIANANNTEYKARFITDGAVELYYDSAKKLETTSTGIDVTGTAEVDTLKFSDNSTQTSAGASTGKAIAMAIVFG